MKVLTGTYKLMDSQLSSLLTKTSDLITRKISEDIKKVQTGTKHIKSYLVQTHHFITHISTLQCNRFAQTDIMAGNSSHTDESESKHSHATQGIFRLGALPAATSLLPDLGTNSDMLACIP